MKLEVKDITKKFGDKQVLKGISFEVESGKALGLLGRNGAGKTTTIRILMDVFRGNSGKVLLDGKEFDRGSVLIGYLPEERGLYPKKKVSEQLIYLGRLRGISKAEATANTKRWLERLDIAEYADKKLETLSKGNQQKVQLASTLVCDPKIVILDEPFSGLDPVNSKILQEVVEELISADKLVIFSSHQMSYVEEFCEDITIIDKGEIALSGNLDEIKREYGKNQLVIASMDINPQELSALISEKLSNVLEVTGVLKDAVIVKNIKNVSRKEVMKALLDADIELERFETYKPSLNDIFVAAVGNQENEDGESNEENESGGGQR